jgi:hypothetical protein
MDKDFGDAIRPKLITVTLRHTGEGIDVAIDRIVRVRANLARYLRRNYDMKAAFVGIEFSQGEHVHMHAIAWTRYLPRPVLQTWLRSQDCTIPNCSHPADDRCEKCKADKVECHHPDGDRQRCNGSFMVDVRQAYNAKEALKYAAKPIVCDADPDVESTEEQRNASMQTLLYFLKLYQRHRIETYGEARKVVKGEDANDEAVDTGICHCGKPLSVHFIGYKNTKGKAYDWRKPGMGGVPPPTWRPESMPF